MTFEEKLAALRVEIEKDLSPEPMHKILAEIAVELVQDIHDIAKALRAAVGA